MIQSRGPAQKEAKEAEPADQPENAATLRELRVSVIDSLRQVSKADWDACANPESTRHGSPVDRFS